MLLSKTKDNTMYKKKTVKMRQGREPLPEGEHKKQLWFYAKEKDIELLGGKKQAQDLLKSLFAQAVKNKQNAT